MITYFYTRFGIGVSDPQWWEYRLRLFQAVTLPSIATHLNHETRWVIMVDGMMNPKLSRELHRIVQETGKAGHIDITPVLAYAHAPRMLGAMLSHHQTVRVIRVDDDDAISHNFLDLAPETDGIHTFPLGYEVDLAGRQMRLTRRPFLSLNTIYQGPGQLVEEYVRLGHHRIQEWADKHQLPTARISTPDKVYIYSRHKQSDSTFGAVRRAIHDDPTTRVFTASARADFGINDARFDEWRKHARTAPSTGNTKTWDRNTEITNQAAQLLKQLDELNRAARRNTANIFE
jgi:hypothetical protein